MRDVVVGAEGCSCLVRDVVVSCELETDVSAISSNFVFEMVSIYSMSVVLPQAMKLIIV
jgi:hypothetical protein